MQIVRNFDELNVLDIPMPQKECLISHIAEAFQGDLTELAKNWKELGITLILIDESDTDQDIDHMDEQTKYLIEFVVQFPEYVLILDPLVIALAVLNDHGSGCFVAGNIRSKTHPIQQLLTQVES
jgi:hypothetical protein